MYALFTQFTACFTSTKVLVLTPAAGASTRSSALGMRTLFTACFTSTKVLILTPEARALGGDASALHMRP
jgi:hypothetical protein